MWAAVRIPLRRCSRHSSRQHNPQQHHSTVRDDLSHIFVDLSLSLNIEDAAQPANVAEKCVLFCYACDTRGMESPLQASCETAIRLMTPAHSDRMAAPGYAATELRQEMLASLLVSLGSAIGGCLRYAIPRAMLGISPGTTRAHLLINVLGSFLIGYIGHLTVTSSP